MIQWRGIYSVSRVVLEDAMPFEQSSIANELISSSEWLPVAAGRLVFAQVHRALVPSATPNEMIQVAPHYDRNKAHTQYAVYIHEFYRSAL